MIAHRSDISAGLCWPSDYFLDKLANGAADYKAYTKLCNRPETRASFRTAIDKELEDKARLAQSNEAVSRNRSQCVQKLRRDYPSSKLTTYPAAAMNGTIDTPGARLHVMMYQHFAMPRMPGTDVDDDALYSKAVVSACDQSYHVQTFDPTRLNRLQKVASGL